MLLPVLALISQIAKKKKRGGGETFANDLGVFAHGLL